jgi:hypothetical protein
MRAACDALGITYAHFNAADRIDPDELTAAVAASRSWPELMQRLGYAANSGSARASLRKAAVTLGVDMSHLSGLLTGHPGGPFAGPADEANLRRAASFIVAAKCALLGHAVSWPLEPAAYDLLVDTKQEGLLRVQVKSGTHVAHDSWVVWITKRPAASSGAGTRLAYTADEIDYFAVVDPEQQVYMLPIGLVGGQQSVTLRKYGEYRIAG